MAHVATQGKGWSVDMRSAQDSAVIERTIDLLGNRLSGDLTADQDANRVVRRIFSPILSEPLEESVAWMSEVLTSHPKILRGTDTWTQTEFATRLKSAIEAAPNKTPQKELLEELAGKFNINTASEKAAEEENQTEGRKK